MNDKQRAEFEKWAADKYILERSKSGAYMSVSTKRAFECWQAALSSVVVDIKNLPSASCTSSGVVYLSNVAEAIEKAGVRHNDE